MESIFRIVTLRNEKKLEFISDINENDVVDLGTGFFIDSNGHFLTAGHVIKYYKTNKIIGVYNGKIYAIEILFCNYPNHNRHKEKIRDFAIGKINIKDITPFKISHKPEFITGESIAIQGYSSDINEENTNIKVNQYKLTIIPCVLFNRLYVLPKRKFNDEEYGGEIGNAFVISFKEEYQVYPSGMSGGPILNQMNEVIGIFVSGSMKARKIKTGIGVMINDVLNEIEESKN